jgi:hypothetical protein
VHLDLGEPLDEAVDERALPEPLQSGHFLVREDQMRRPVRSRDLRQPVHQVGSFNADISPEIHRVVEGFLDVPGSIERLALELGVSTTTATKLGRSELARVAARRTARTVAGDPSTSTRMRSVTSGSCSPAIVSSS